MLMQHSIRGLKSVDDQQVDDNTKPTIRQYVNQPRRRNSHQGQGQESPPPDQSDQLSPSVLEAKLPRFGPIYGEDNEANQIAKTLAWEHILQHDQADHHVYLSCIMKIEAQAMKSYETSVIQKLKPGSEFREMMVRDGCFFLQLALYILGGGTHLGYSDQNPYFGEDKEPSQWIPAMFFVGNQIPYIVIRALMSQPFFQNVIKKGVDSGTWRRPPQELVKLVLYRTVVEPELTGLARLPVLFSRWKDRHQSWDPPHDILHHLHAVLLGSGNDDPVHSEMKEFPDLEANKEDSDIMFPSAGELLKSGIRLRKAKDGITNIRFRNLVIFARLDVPPLTIDSDTEHVLRNVTSYEQNLNESDREVTSYLRFIRDLAPTYKDFKILERNGIIQVKDGTSKYTMLLGINKLVASHKCNFTLNFSYNRRRITDYEKPPWGFISFIFGVFTVVQTIFAVLPYFVATKQP